MQQREHAQQIENIVHQLQQMQMQYAKSEPISTTWSGPAVRTPATTFFSDDDAKETVDEVSQATANEAEAGVAQKVREATKRINQVLAHLNQEESGTGHNSGGQRSLRGSTLLTSRE